MTIADPTIATFRSIRFAVTAAIWYLRVRFAAGSPLLLRISMMAQKRSRHSVGYPSGVVSPWLPAVDKPARREVAGLVHDTVLAGDGPVAKALP